MRAATCGRVQSVGRKPTACTNPVHPTFLIHGRAHSNHTSNLGHDSRLTRHIQSVSCRIIFNLKPVAGARALGAQHRSARGVDPKMWRHTLRNGLSENLNWPHWLLYCTLLAGYSGIGSVANHAVFIRCHAICSRRLCPLHRGVVEGGYHASPVMRSVDPGCSSEQAMERSSLQEESPSRTYALSNKVQKRPAYCWNLFAVPAQGGGFVSNRRGHAWRICLA